jgi:uncharacterized protein YkwD
VTGTALRIASASAAAVVSAAVAGAAWYGASAIGDPGTPNRDERLIAVPATPSPAATVSPPDTTTDSPSPKLRSTSASPVNRAHALSRPDKCNVHQKGSGCYRPLKSHAPATRTITPSTTAKKRTPAQSAKPTPAKRATQSVKSTPSKTASSSSGYATRSDWADAVLDELNGERANRGLPALKLNSKLVDSAHTHNLAMAKANTLSHQLSGEAALGSRVSGAGYEWSLVGENIAYNSSQSESGVLALQKAMYNEKPPDDGHRENILNKNFVDVGIDVINDSVHDKVWLVTDFGKP